MINTAQICVFGGLLAALAASNALIAVYVRDYVVAAKAHMELSKAAAERAEERHKRYYHEV